MEELSDRHELMELNPHSKSFCSMCFVKGSTGMKCFHLFLLCLLLLALPAYGDTMATFPLNVDLCTANSCGNGPFGAVTLDQSGADVVTVSVALNSGYLFVRTGAGNALQFALSAGIIDSSSLASDLTLSSKAITGGTKWMIDCAKISGVSCGISTILFDIDDANLSDFMTLSGKGSTYYFADDIGVEKPGGGFSATGVVASSNRIQSVAPEPSSLLLMGTGVFGVFLTAWFGKRRLALKP